MKIIDSQKNTHIMIDTLNSSLSLLQTLWTHSLYNNKALCSGIGKCGKCKILFHSPAPSPSSDEIKILLQEEIDRGIRLACKHNANPNYIIELLEDFPYSESEEKQSLLIFSDKNKENAFSLRANKEKAKACLALDFGTTTLEYELVCDGQVIAHGKKLNPMQGIGSEVMTRLEFAKNPKQAELLKVKTLALLQEICEEALTCGYFVEKIIFSANSVMTYLAFAFESSCLASAPYSLEFKGDCFLEFENLPPIYVPPLLAPFIGGDISSGLYALKNEYELDYPYIYIDMGTNAEFALAINEEEYIITSVPLGPSIEGIGLTFGTLAGPSSIVDFQVTPLGIKPELLDKNEINANGICGIGYLNLLSALKKLSLLDKSGHFSVQDSMPLARKVAHIFQHQGEACLKIDSRFYLSSSDIELILMVKSAFRTAFEILIHEANKIKNVSLNYSAIKRIYLAGALGKHSKIQSLVELGFLPNIADLSVIQVGNMSLSGARILCAKDKEKEIHTHFTKLKHIELAEHSLFKEYYMKHFSLSN